MCKIGRVLLRTHRLTYSLAIKYVFVIIKNNVQKSGNPSPPHVAITDPDSFLGVAERLHVFTFRCVTHQKHPPHPTAVFFTPPKASTRTRGAARDQRPTSEAWGYHFETLGKRIQRSLQSEECLTLGWTRVGRDTSLRGSSEGAMVASRV